MIYDLSVLLDLIDDKEEAKLLNEYERLYNENFGFEFPYNRRIGKSKPMSWRKVKMVPIGKCNEDEVPLFVKCTKCNCYMDYVGDWYICDNCGARVKERTLYSQLDKENQEFENRMDDDYDEYWE